MLQTITLKAGDTIPVNAGELRVIKCGLHREGAGPPRPTVTIEVDAPTESESAEGPAEPTESPPEKPTPAPVSEPTEAAATSVTTPADPETPATE